MKKQAKTTHKHREGPNTQKDMLGRVYLRKVFICQQCGAKFRAIHGNAKYCPARPGYQCREQAHKARHQKGTN